MSARKGFPSIKQVLKALHSQVQCKNKSKRMWGKNKATQGFKSIFKSKMTS